MLKKLLLILITVVFLLGMSKLSSAMMCHGGGSQHSSHEHSTQTDTGHKHTEPDTTTQAISKESVDIGNKICPVSGEKIDQNLKVTYEYKGKVYNFCCASCIDEFKKDPEKYIKKVEEELQVESVGQSEGEEHEIGMKQESGTSHQEMHESHQH